MSVKRIGSDEEISKAEMALLAIASERLFYLAGNTCQDEPLACMALAISYVAAAKASGISEDHIRAGLETALKATVVVPMSELKGTVEALERNKETKH